MRTKFDFVRLANGVTHESPATNEPPLVLLHGLSDRLRSYDLGARTRAPETV